MLASRHSPHGQGNTTVALTANMQGAGLMVLSMAAFTFNDACIKATGGALPLFQLLFLRGVLATILIFGLAYAVGALSWRISHGDWGMIALRSGAEIGAAWFFLTALLNMPLANVTAILQALPLTVTLGAALVFREQVGWRRMLAILVGFVGVSLIIRPGPDGFNLYAIYAIVAVGFVTVRDLATRRLSPQAPSLMVTLAASVAITMFSGVASFGVEWAAVTPRLAALIVASSVFILGGYLFSVLVMRTGEISFIAPFRYTGLIWALALGWFLFGDWPDQITLLGAGVVAATGLFTLYRERLARRRLKTSRT